MWFKHSLVRFEIVLCLIETAVIAGLAFVVAVLTLF